MEDHEKNLLEHKFGIKTKDALNALVMRIFDVLPTYSYYEHREAAEVRTLIKKYIASTSH